ncbi:MAG: putative DNA-binding transcriptional regulator YafY [Enterobacterales bacterium]|jgi:predicted DNA-binding transcriptional regulator YafY
MPSNRSMPAIKWDLLLRYRLIEIICFWEGRLTTNHLQNAFKIGRQQASKDINVYKKAYPENLEYDLQLKGYRPTIDFTPIYTKGTVDEYLHLLKTSMDLGQRYVDTFLPQANTEVILPISRGVTPEILRPVIQACRENRRLDIKYVSLSSAEQTEERLICPHTLVNSGFRWHVRAYCEKNQQYRDFVLSRMEGIPEVEDEAAYTIEEDEAWNTEVQLIIKPHQGLTKAQKKVIEKDYSMQDGELVVTTRGALVEYMLQILHIDKQTDKRPAVQQQVELANFNDVKRWCFGG